MRFLVDDLKININRCALIASITAGNGTFLKDAPLCTDSTNIPFKDVGRMFPLQDKNSMKVSDSH